MAEVFIKKAYKNALCEWEKDIGCFEDAAWYIEGGNYCQFHAQKVIQKLNELGANIDPNKIKRR